ncbi:MAG: hypothetical protein AAEB43_05190 [Acidimicrobiales bacterium]
MLGLLAVVVLIEVKAPAEQSGELMSPGASILLAFPAETLVDLVTFADYIAVIEITGETEIIHPDDLARGEGLVLRDVHAEAVQVLWSFSDEKKLDATFSLRTFGSIMRDGGQRSSMAGPWGMSFEVGGQYLVAIFEGWITEEFPEKSWGHLFALTLEDGRVSPVERETTPLAVALSGQSVDEVMQQLSKTLSDPLAVPRGEIAPIERASRLAFSRHAETFTSTTEGN